MRKMFGAAVAAGVALAAAPAMAATTVVDFNFLAGSTSLASGEFTYDSAKTGTIGWDDLDSFSIDVLGVGYDLAFVNSGGFGEFRYLGWDTAGPIAAEESYDQYRHDSGWSVSWARKTPYIIGMFGGATLVFASVLESNALIIALMSFAYFSKGVAADKIKTSYMKNPGPLVHA